MSVRTEYRRQARKRSRYADSYAGVFHGAMGRSESVSAVSGMTFSRSTPITRPKPWQAVQAPRGELNAKRAGVGSRKSAPQPGQWRPRRNVRVRSSTVSYTHLRAHETRHDL